MSLRRFTKGAEWIGWWMVLVAAVIGVYYAIILSLLPWRGVVKVDALTIRPRVHLHPQVRAWRRAAT